MTPAWVGIRHPSPQGTLPTGCYGLIMVENSHLLHKISVTNGKIEQRTMFQLLARLFPHALLDDQ